MFKYCYSSPNKYNLQNKNNNIIFLLSLFNIIFYSILTIRKIFKDFENKKIISKSMFSSTESVKVLFYEKLMYLYQNNNREI